MKNGKYPARLYSIDSNGNDGLTIEFPAMPETLTLARESQYEVHSSPLHPDGAMHIYKSTNSLSVPVSFKMHAQDDRSCDGPMDLLTMAANLHALSLPMLQLPGAAKTLLSRTSGNVVGTEKFTLVSAPSGGSTQGGGGADASSGIPRFPPVCVLDLVTSVGGSGSGFGVRIVGYVRAVDVKLKGPWMQVKGGNWGTRNLPSSAEFSFTFVSAPNYRNKWDAGQTAHGGGGSFAAGQQQLGQGYAELVRDAFYDTLALADRAITPATAVALGGVGDHGTRDEQLQANDPIGWKKKEDYLKAGPQVDAQRRSVERAQREFDAASAAFSAAKASRNAAAIEAAKDRLIVAMAHKMDAEDWLEALKNNRNNLYDPSVFL